MGCCVAYVACVAAGVVEAAAACGCGAGFAGAIVCMLLMDGPRSQLNGRLAGACKGLGEKLRPERKPAFASCLRRGAGMRHGGQNYGDQSKKAEWALVMVEGTVQAAWLFMRVAPYFLGGSGLWPLFRALVPE